MEYKISKTCKKCKNTDYFPLTKIELAFELFDAKKLRETPCYKCGLIDINSISFNKPNIDAELLNIWAANPNYQFMEQDEEIIISDITNYKEILNIIDENKFPRQKLRILVASMLVLLYDNVIAEYEFSKSENRLRAKVKDLILPELKKRKDVLINFSDEIMDYIKDETFPLIFDY